MDIHGYQPPWKALSEFALHTDIDRLDPNGPQFQHLVGQVIFDGVCEDEVVLMDEKSE